MNDVQILNIPNEEYHARPEWSSSQLKLLPDEVELFYRRHVEHHPAFQFKQSESMKRGTEVHDIVLENTPIVMIPRDVLSKSGAKAGNPWKDFEAAHPGAVLCKNDDPRLFMAESIRNEPTAQKWLDAEGPVEQSIIYRCEQTGLGLRARLDKLAMTSSSSVVIDLKSTLKDPYNAREIGKVIYDIGYHRQMAWYWDAVEKLGHEVAVAILVFFRNKPPYDCHAWELSPSDIELGRLQNRRARSDLAIRLQTNKWKPEAFGRTSIVELPEWAYKQENGHGD